MIIWRSWLHTATTINIRGTALSLPVMYWIPWPTPAWNGRRPNSSTSVSIWASSKVASTWHWTTRYWTRKFRQVRVMPQQHWISVSCVTKVLKSPWKAPISQRKTSHGALTSTLHSTIMKLSPSTPDRKKCLATSDGTMPTTICLLISAA